jgi:hypothetical protein
MSELIVFRRSVGPDLAAEQFLAALRRIISARHASEREQALFHAYRGNTDD